MFQEYSEFMKHVEASLTVGCKIDYCMRHFNQLFFAVGPFSGIWTGRLTEKRGFAGDIATR